MKPGDLLASKYRLEHVLGSGGMGEVWAAVNEATGRSFAIKLIHVSTEALRTRMLREARAGGVIKHRNIVDVFDVGETSNGDPFLVMELLSGETLEDRLKREGSLPPAVAVEIASAIAAALRAAHAKGIVHRDLKPANVFLHNEADGEGSVVKVVDFGVAKHLLESTATLTAGLVGSPAYMSPEQACQDTTVDARADLWSLGVVLFEMLAGRRPFRCASPYLVIAEVVNGPIPSIAAEVPGLPPGLVRVVERCLTRDVRDRVPTADELLRLLAGSLRVPSVGSSPPGPSAEVATMPMGTTVKIGRALTLPLTVDERHSALAGPYAPQAAVAVAAPPSTTITLAQPLRAAANAPSVTQTNPDLVADPTTNDLARRAAPVSPVSSVSVPAVSTLVYAPGPPPSPVSAVPSFPVVQFAPLAEGPAVIDTPIPSAVGPIPIHGPSNTTVALVTMGALALVTMLGLAVWRTPPAVERAAVPSTAQPSIAAANPPETHETPSVAQAPPQTSVDPLPTPSASGAKSASTPPVSSASPASPTSGPAGSTVVVRRPPRVRTHPDGTTKLAIP